ncbi:MAG: extracellular solute-binding protein, partial [Chthonomonadales bacterium]
MWTGQEEKSWLAVIKQYEKSHSGIHIENLGGVIEDSRTVRALVAGSPPDLFTIADPLFLGSLAANDALLPLDDLFKSSGFKHDDFIVASLKICQFKGRLYAMPYLVDCFALLWNKKLFKEAGMDPERPPATTEELAVAIRKLTKTKDDQLVQLGLQPPVEFNAIPAMFGAYLLAPDGKTITPDSKENLAALNWYMQVIKDEGGNEKVTAFAAGFGQMQSPNNPFFTGQAAMSLGGEWMPNWCERYAPNLDYGVAPMPHPANRPDLKAPTFIGGNVFCIPKDSRHAKEAWDLLAWMQTDEAQILFAELMNGVPNRRSALKASTLRTGSPRREKFGQFFDLAESPDVRFFPSIPVATLY